MRDGFVRHGANQYVAKFSDAEREVLVNLSEQMVELLAERADSSHDDPLAKLVGITSHDTPPEDEVLYRLLPNAYADDSSSAEFRRYTEATLREKKRTHSMFIRSQLINSGNEEIQIDHEGALAWLGGMNDIRLALGVRLKIEDTNHDQLELLKPDDPLRAVYAVYTWLGWLQGTLIDALMDEEK